jgi:hypothetical protein
MKLNGQFCDPAALPRGKEPRYPMDRRLGGPQSRSGRSEEKNDLLCLLGYDIGAYKCHSKYDYKAVISLCLQYNPWGSRREKIRLEISSVSYINLCLFVVE